jgi:hypothetical protein
MWNWFNCYLSGRHEYGMWCEPGTIFLRCVHCGRRSAGWTVEGKNAQPAVPPTPALRSTVGLPRVVPFNRSVAS